MLVCGNCQNGLPDGTIFCDYCGNEIIDISPAESPDASRHQNLRQGYRSLAQDPSRGPAVVVAPPARALQQADEVLDATESDQQTPPSLSAVNARAAHPPEAGTLPEPKPVEADISPPTAREATPARTRVIHLQLGREVFELSGQNTYLVGRRDVDQHLFPDIDLHDWDGAGAGVSRRHLIIRVLGNVFSIEDLESRNSTIVNGYRLFPHQQYPLVDGDEIRLGDITLLVNIIV
jgi:FHA domain